MNNNKVKILIAEDDAFVSEIYRIKLTAAGFEVAIAENGEDVIEKIKSGDYKMVLLDIMMPETGDLEILPKIKDFNKKNDCKIIILTNSDNKENVSQAMSKGADDYLIKSMFTPEEVLQKIKNVLEK